MITMASLPLFLKLYLPSQIFLLFPLGTLLLLLAVSSSSSSSSSGICNVAAFTTTTISVHHQSVTRRRRRRRRRRITTTNTELLFQNTNNPISSLYSSSLIISGNNNNNNNSNDSSFKLFANNNDNDNDNGKQQGEDDDVEEKQNENVPNIQTLRDDIRKWSRVRSRHDAPNEAAHALREMFRYYDPTIKKNKNIIIKGYKGRHSRQTVDVIDCTQVINTWSKSRQKDAPQQALSILNKMIAIYKKDSNNNNQSSSIRPNVFAYTGVINAFARKGDYNGAMGVFKMQLNDYKNENNQRAKPNVITFSAMIDACSKSDREDIPEIAEKLVATIDTWYARGDLEEGPNTITYNSAINCWSKSNRPEALGRTLGILETMILKFEDGNEAARPNTITYNSVIDAHARQGDIDGANKVFKMMNNYAKPNIQTYNILIHSWSKSNSQDAPTEAESLLMKIYDLEERPNTITYNVVINCWSKSNRPEAPSRVLNILNTMISKYKEDDGNQQAVRPDTITYAAVMDAYARQGDVDGTNTVFKMMQKDYNSGNKNAKPNIKSYTILIDAWSKSNNHDAPKEASSLLMEMIDLYNKGDLEESPGTATYNAVINCWSKSTNRPNASSHALDILKTMIIQYKEDCNKKIRPNVVTYAAVMDAYARRGDIEGTNMVFTMMKKDYNSGNKNAKPNLFTYNILLDAWANSGNLNAPVEVENILQEIKQKTKEGPDIYTITTMIKCLKQYHWSEKRIQELELEYNM
jgi:pentatricopeptide repeat protein